MTRWIRALDLSKDSGFESPQGHWLVVLGRATLGRPYNVFSNVGNRSTTEKKTEIRFSPEGVKFVDVFSSDIN